MARLAAAWLLLAMGAGQSRAEEAADFGAPINYIYANYFGSGIYETSTRSVTVINLPSRYQLSSENGSALFLRYSLAVGFFDLDYQGIHDLDLPNNFDTLSFTLGLEYQFLQSDQNQIIPYLDLGVGRNYSYGENTLLYSTGVSDLYTFAGKHLWATRLVVAGYQSLDYEDESSYASLETGVDLHTPWQPTVLNKALFTTVYGAGYWYFDALHFRMPHKAPEKVTQSFEVGVTVGLQKPIDAYLFEFTRLGIGYRFSKNITAWRLVFGLPI